MSRLPARLCPPRKGLCSPLPVPLSRARCAAFSPGRLGRALRAAVCRCAALALRCAAYAAARAHGTPPPPLIIPPVSRAWPFARSLARHSFSTDTDAELELVKAAALAAGAEAAVVGEHHARGGEGAVEVARAVQAACAKSRQAEKDGTGGFKYLYPLELPLKDKIETIAKEMCAPGRMRARVAWALASAAAPGRPSVCQAARAPFGRSARDPSRWLAGGLALRVLVFLPIRPALRFSF